MVAMAYTVPYYRRVEGVRGELKVAVIIIVNLHRRAKTFRVAFKLK